MFNPLRALTLDGPLLFSAPGHAAPTTPDTLYIGYQKGSANTVLAKGHQLPGQRYPGAHISWIEFPAGPQMPEVLNVGSVDIGSTGDIPPIFAQTAGADLVCIGSEPPKPRAGVILMAQGSPIHNVVELKEKKVVFRRGSSSHNLLLRILQLADLKLSDIQPVYLTLADARVALQQGNVDTWTIWDPYYSAAPLQGGTRVLTDGADLKQTGSFYLASCPCTERNGAFIEGALGIFTQADALTHSQRVQSTALLAKTMGLPEAVIASYLDHRSSTSVAPVSVETIARQRQTADLFCENKLMPKKADIRAHI